jgi:putative ABC transport system ATP-binding protein
MTNLLLKTENLTKNYTLGSEQVHALRGVSVEITRGDFVAVTGASGSGKSTFMNLLGCLDAPSSGRYILDGRDVSRLTADELAEVRNRKIGFVFQSFNLLPRTPAIENVELPLRYGGMARSQRHARAREVLAAVGLQDRVHHHPAQLSGGQQQRVAIARAFITDPTLISADEPTGDLDKDSAREVLDLLCRLNGEFGKTIILVTHDPEAASRAPRLIRLIKGELITDERNDRASCAIPGEPAPPA